MICIQRVAPRMVVAMMFLASLFACSKSSEPVGATTEALDAGSAVAVTTHVSTPSAATYALNKFVVGETDTTNHIPAWSISTNGGGTWTRCDVTNPANCNGGATPPVSGQVGWVLNPKGGHDPLS